MDFVFGVCFSFNKFTMQGFCLVYLLPLYCQIIEIVTHLHTHYKEKKGKNGVVDVDFYCLQCSYSDCAFEKPIKSYPYTR